MLLIILIVAGSGAWFLFDGLVSYPGSNVRWSAHDELKKQHGEKTPELDAAWKEVARQKGWDPAPPKKFHTPGDIQTQLVLGALGLLGGAICGWHYFRSLSTTTKLDHDIITLPDGSAVPLDKIVAISKKRWENKGIADLLYEAGRGAHKKFILDDYKYIGAEKILEAAEKTLAAKAPAEPSPPQPQDDSERDVF